MQSRLYQQGYLNGLKMTAAAGLLLLSGCASLQDDYRDPRDPWENYNRAVTSFNDNFDQVVGRPVARVYQKFTPDVVDRGITNFFRNLEDVPSAVNNLLQGKFHNAVSNLGRVVFNTTLGLFGFIDVATPMDFVRYKEDFGQTLGHWGMPTGPYFVLPLLGPSDVRDTFGLVADTAMNAQSYIEDEPARWSLRLVEAVDTRADLLGASRVMQEASLDSYEFVRDAYLQKRRSDVFDGDPPIDDEYYFPADDPAPDAEPAPAN